MRIQILPCYLILVTVLLFEFTIGGLSFHKLTNLGEDVANKVVGAEEKAVEEAKRLIKNLSVPGLILDVISFFGNSMPISREALEAIKKYDKLQDLKMQDRRALVKCRSKASNELMNVNKMKKEVEAYMIKAVAFFLTKMTRRKTNIDPQAKRIIDQMQAITVYFVNMLGALNTLVMNACGAAGGNQNDFKALPKAARKLYRTTGHCEGRNSSMELAKRMTS
ncbi:hypothetical protein DFH28DRAFT_880599 [Melampsora americana]|nr:hypothetical protein DFH28DRAFT_880599 [Melampsora americana]